MSDHDPYSDFLFAELSPWQALPMSARNSLQCHSHDV
jgi:hypothetical protein